MSQADQLVLDIAPTPSFAAEDFLTGASNSAAHALIDTLAWPIPIGLILGEQGSGKTHLAHIFAGQRGEVVWFTGAAAVLNGSTTALIIDGLERYMDGDQDVIFHTLEAARAAQLPVLVTSQQAPETLGLKRPDTVSRLRAGERAQISLPDDAMFTAIAVKLFTDRQLMVDPAIASYLLQRMERSYANLTKLIALIDERSLAAGRSITKVLAGEVLKAYELSHS